MRGDRPWMGAEGVARAEFTPHARGSTPLLHFLVAAETVYPACAGIDPPSVVGYYVVAGLPRMRGDRPSM